MRVESKLILENGYTFEGVQFGASKSVVGEVVFNTAMTGYPESLTDPSFKGQILVCAFPLIGNYGVPDHAVNEKLEDFFESQEIQISGLVVSYESIAFSHWNAAQSLSNWLEKHGVPGLFGVDTRAIIKKIREHGTVLGSLGPKPLPLQANLKDLVNQVSTKEVVVHNEGGVYKIALVDCGVKQNIIRSLVKRNLEVHVVPHDYDYNQGDFDGIFLSNGPGDPEDCIAAIRHLRQAMYEAKQPIYGICLGSQLMGLAAGGKTYKLKFGHRGHNQPVMHVDSKKCYITSQNHGYAVDQDTLPYDWVMTYVNLNDGSCEGVKHVSKPYTAVQFHPEAFGGPTDTEFIFDDFISEIETFKAQHS